MEPTDSPVSVERDCNTCARHDQAGRRLETARRMGGNEALREAGRDVACFLCLSGKNLPDWRPLEPHWIPK